MKPFLSCILVAAMSLVYIPMQAWEFTRYKPVKIHPESTARSNPTVLKFQHRTNLRAKFTQYESIGSYSIVVTGNRIEIPTIGTLEASGISETSNGIIIQANNFLESFTVFIGNYKDYGYCVRVFNTSTNILFFN